MSLSHSLAELASFTVLRFNSAPSVNKWVDPADWKWCSGKA